MRKQKPKKKNKSTWTPFEEGVSTLALEIQEKGREAVVLKMMEQYAPELVTREQIEKTIDDLLADKIWINHLYQVNIHYYKDNKLVHISVKRRNKSPVHDWRHLQRIKNELLGDEYEAIELYPAESRKVDTANQYHLWAYNDPNWRFPVGFQDRYVGTPEQAARVGAKQRREEDGDS